LQRKIAAKKFYATLPHKIDRATEKWLEEVVFPKVEPEFTETLEGETPLGGEMRLRSKSKK
jgi:hypothetical protein